MSRVSVVVPLYNKGSYIQRALTSIAEQTFGDFEAIIVDDGSTDEGPAIVSSFKDPRFRLIRQANAGPGAARNRGIAEASGEFIAFLDADDEWLPGYLGIALDALTRYTEAAAVTCGYVLSPGERSTEEMWRKRGLNSGIQHIAVDMPVGQFIHSIAFMTPPSTFSRAAMLRKWGGFYAHNCRYAEDAFLWLRVLLNEKVLFDLTPYVRIHSDASALSGNLKSVRPLEPFLHNPREVERDCPAALKPLLARFLTARAFKTACVLGYWGSWRHARTLRNQFRLPGDRALPYYWPSLVCATPLGAAIGNLARLVASAHR